MSFRPIRPPHCVDIGEILGIDVLPKRGVDPGCGVAGSSYSLYLERKVSSESHLHLQAFWVRSGTCTRTKYGCLQSHAASSSQRTEWGHSWEAEREQGSGEEACWASRGFKPSCQNLARSKALNIVKLAWGFGVHNTPVEEMSMTVPTRRCRQGSNCSIRAVGSHWLAWLSDVRAALGAVSHQRILWSQDFSYHIIVNRSIFMGHVLAKGPDGQRQLVLWGPCM